MNRIWKRILIILLIMGICLCVFMFAEEITALKRSIYAYVAEYRSAEETAEVATEADAFEELYDSFPAFTHSQDAWYMKNKLVYHAGGGIDGMAYTNSLEAIEATLQHGKVLEIDFAYTEDRSLVCLHSWDYIAGNVDPLTLEEFLSFKIYAKYTPLTAKDLIDIMDREKDLYIIIDTKEMETVEIVQDLILLAGNRADIVDRFIIQLYYKDTRHLFEELYPFQDENFLFTCYKYSEDHEEILRVCMKEGLSVVTVPYGAWDAEQIDMFNRKGIIIYEHTVNRLDLVLQSMDNGVYGFYTDFLTSFDP